MKRVKKIIISIITVLVSLLLVYNLYNFFCIKILKHDLATINGYAVLEVVSGSMEPTIHVGDMIIINTKDNNYKEDDIVTFYDVNGSFVTHRIISINEDEIVTQGDNNNTEDDPISIDSIVGKYAFRISGLGKLLSAFKSPFVMIMILIIGILACVFISIDKEGNVILDEEEKEFQEYLNSKNNSDAKKKEIKKETAIKSTTKNKSTKKVVNKKVTTKKKVK